MASVLNETFLYYTTKMFINSLKEITIIYYQIMRNGFCSVQTA